MQVKRFLKFVLIPAANALLLSCHGILGGLYDLPESAPESGFIEDWGNTGTVMINVEPRDQWTYIDFSEKNIVKRDIQYPLDQVVDGKDYSIPDEWDIALHRTECKTNEGAVLETAFPDFNGFLGLQSAPQGNYVEDVPPCPPDQLQNEDYQGKVSVDLSQMMQGIIGYAPTNLNLELTKWVKKDMSTMPPTYSVSGKVYLVRFNDEVYLGLKALSFDSENKVLTLKYFYPIEF